MSVYDKTEQAVFVILGDAGKELTGKHAAELVANYFEVLSDLTIYSKQVGVMGSSQDIIDSDIISTHVHFAWMLG